MSDRDIAKFKFLRATQWADWSHHAIAQDASSRSYTRLSNGSHSVILMDAPPDMDKSMGPFIQIGTYLRNIGLAAPKLLEDDRDQGFLVLEDLGTTDFAKAMRADPQCTQELYYAAADVLLEIPKHRAPDLHKMDANTAGEMVRIAAEYYVQSPALADALSQNVTDMVDTHCGPADTLALRDYHAENLIWRPNQSGVQRVGLLDFQDAFIAPAGYDLASLLRDARHDVDDKLAASVTAYVAAKTLEEPSSLALRVRCLAIQRNLRILGVFGRLISVHDKPRYAAMLPRVYRYIIEDLDHPALGKLRELVNDSLPPPNALNFPKAPR